MRLLLSCAIALLACVNLLAQTGKNVGLTWADDLNPSSTTYNAYRAPGSCSGTPGFAKINVSPIALKTYTDPSVPVGVYCYRVTAVYETAESAPSNSAGALIPPESVTGLTVIVQ